MKFKFLILSLMFCLLFTSSAFAEDGFIVSSFNYGHRVIGDYYEYQKIIKDTDDIVNNLYTIKFDSNGGKGKMKNEALLKGKKEALSKVEFTRENYEFKGWAESKDGEVMYSDGAEVKNLAKPKNEVVLYAVWESTYISASGKVVEAKAGDMHPHGKLGDQSDEVGFGTFNFNNSRGVIYVIRATDASVANELADVATRLAENQKVGYDQSSSKHQDLWEDLKKSGPDDCSGDVSCSTLAMVSLKYALLHSKDFKDVSDLLSYDWRSAIIANEIESVCKSLDNKPCEVYRYDEVKNDLKRGDIMTTTGHTFILL